MFDRFSGVKNEVSFGETLGIGICIGKKMYGRKDVGGVGGEYEEDRRGKCGLDD